LITGKPVSGNRKGFRAIVVPARYKHTLYDSSNIKRRERIASYPLLNYREYSTESTIVKSNIFNRINKLNQESKNLKPIDRTLYSLVCNLDMLKLAYEKLKSKPGNMTSGITSKTLDGISVNTLEELLVELKTEKFQFKPSRRVETPKIEGEARNLLIAPPRDKLVQEVIRTILEAIFEPRFQNESHGFRRNRSCHTALKYAKYKFQPSI
jgi:retron-type reverse transcriptase